MSVLNRWHWLNGRSVMRWTAAVLCNSSPPVLPSGRPVGPGTLGLEILLPPAQSTSDVYRGTVGWYVMNHGEKVHVFLTVCPRILPFLLILLKCDPFIESIYVVNAT